MKFLIEKIKMFTGNKNRHAGCVLAIVSALMLTACGDSTSTQANPNTNNNNNNGAIPPYNGPPPDTTDIQNFKTNFWNNLSADNRCGGCHVENGDPPAFAHKDNINTAYLAALGAVDNDNYANSLFVTQVASGHNCWLTDNNACATIVEGYIAAWKGAAPNASGRQIVLTAPPIKDPGASKNFPATAQDTDPPDNGLNSFANRVYPLLTQFCSDCHAEMSATPTSPFFASDNVNSAYDAAKAKMNLDSPRDSRLVIRLREEFHNCWTTNCLSDAQDMQDRISDFAGAIQLTVVDPTLITSKAVTLDDATIASGGSRYETNTIALWEFKTGNGTETFDTSGVEPALDLTFSGTVDWVLGDGIEIINGKAQGSTANSQKLHDLIKATGEYALEAWVVPGNVSQEDASIFSYSAGGGSKNFTMAQSLYNYQLLNRTEVSDAAGNPALSTADADEDLQATLQHVVMNYHPTNGREIYVNGVFTDDLDANIGGSLVDWNNSYAFVLGDEPSGGALWKGKIRLAAIHNRTLTPAQITQNFSVGVGKKYFLLFSVAERLGPGYEDTYILFHVEQFDNYSYLFNEPRFISLNNSWVPTTPIPIKGLRIAVNGKEAVAAQAFGNIDVTVNSVDYDITNNGQFLSTQGTIIPLEKGPQSDEFFLTFEQLGTSLINPYDDPPAVVIDPDLTPDAAAVSDIGLKTFEEINATMSEATGISTANSIVNTTYDTYRQQLPVVENISTYLASHQMAVAQLAMSYCSVLVDTNKPYFSGFNFSNPASTAFDSAGQAAVMDPLLAAIMNIDPAAIPAGSKDLLNQPDETVIRNMLGDSAVQDLDPALSGDSYESLIECMTRCAVDGVGAAKCPIYIDDDPLTNDTTCTTAEVNIQNTTTRTEEVVKAVCAATLGSASMLVQ